MLLKLHNLIKIRFSFRSPLFFVARERTNTKEDLDELANFN